MKSLAVVGAARPDPLRRPPGVLLARRPRVRMGTDAARPRSGGRRRGLEPARLGTADGQDPTRPAAAGDQPSAEPAGRRPRPAGGGRTSLHAWSMHSTRSPARPAKTVPQMALNWLLQRPSVANVIIGARDEAQLRQNLGAIELAPDARADVRTRRGQRRHAGLSVLASAGLREKSAAGLTGAGDSGLGARLTAVARSRRRGSEALPRPCA